ncbi:site-specific integrase [Pedobacter gandavensis]|uniref:phage integrase SAM-like domain and Arm DNA-binding domain-containing protein n=1 Tax=Pedobacter gandavensis TaxID=2679963 RepID=UPI00292DF3B6|nr:site-specific integrase [Pedobacter gandavensis]
MKTNFTLLFYLKKPKNYSNGVVPIYLRITVEGNRAELATSRKCEPNQWNAKAGHLIGTKDDIRALNAYLDKMKAEVYVAHSLLCAEDAEIRAESIKCRFLGKEEKTHTLCEAIKTHNKNMKKLVGKDYAIGTLKRFEILERHVNGFLASKYHKSNINIKYVNYDFISGFDYYLRTAQNNTTNTAVKHLKNLGKIIRICLSEKWITTDPFFGYKLKTKVVHREYLTADELRKIEEKEFTTTRLSQVKDVFLFSCYTGYYGLNCASYFGLIVPAITV